MNYIKFSVRLFFIEFLITGFFSCIILKFYLNSSDLGKDLMAFSFVNFFQIFIRFLLGGYYLTWRIVKWLDDLSLSPIKISIANIFIMLLLCNCLPPKGKNFRKSLTGFSR